MKLISLSIFCGIVYFLTHYQNQFLGIGHHDEGVALYGAVNLLEGKIPFRDYYFFFPPGFISFLSLVFKIFGTSVINARLSILFIQSISVSLAFILSARLGSLIFGLMTFFMLSVFKTTILMLSVPLVLLVYIYFDLYIRSQKNKYLFIIGITSGIISFFRIDFSVYAFSAIFITLILKNFIQKHVYKIIKTEKRLNLLSLFSTNIPVFSGSYILGLIPLILFILKAGLYSSLKHLFVYVPTVALNRRLPYPQLLLPGLFNNFQTISLPSLQDYFLKILPAWPFYFPYLICGLVFIDIIIRRKNLLKNNHTLFYMKFLSTISILLFSLYTIYRPDIDHLWPIYPFVFILIPSALDGFYSIVKKFKLAAYFSLSILGIAFYLLWSDHYPNLIFKYLILLTPIVLVFIITRHRRIFNFHKLAVLLTLLFFLVNLLMLEELRIFKVPEYKQDEMVFLNVPRSGGIYISKYIDPDYDNLVKYLLSVNKSGDYMFIGSTRHDKIYVNDTMLYFLTNTKSPTRYWWYDPGIQSEITIQHEMVESIKKTKPKYAVLWILASESDEPNMSNLSSGVIILDDYIKINYGMDKQIGNYIVLKRIV